MIDRRKISVMLVFFMVLTAGLSIGYADTNTQTAANEQTASGNSASAASTAFSDTKGHWAETVIKEAVEQNIIGGYPDWTFRPDNLIKREEFFKMLTNILTVTPDTSNTKIGFKDVVENEWYVPTIKIAVASGITQGYGDGTFGIGLMISRQEAAKVAGSVISSQVDKNAAGAETARDKGSIANWAYQYVDLMFQKGYMKGDTEGNFRPTMALTRAEAATILLNVKTNEKIIAANADTLIGSKCLKVHDGEAGAFTAGNGTQGEPYEIYTEAQLNHIRMHTTEGAFYILKKNIAITEDYAEDVPKDMDEPNWSAGNFEPIGNEQTPFEGTLDGNGYTISGLNIIGTEGHGEDKRAASYAGLFGYVAKDSSIKDLTVDASDIEGNQYVGSIAGYNEGSVTDCTLGSKGVINGNTDTGGLVGYSSAPLSSLRNLGKVTGETVNTGGIVGSISAPGNALLYCQNEGSVTGKEKTGGIVGSFTYAKDSDTVAKECYNKGTVEGGSYQAGGIAGYAGAGYYSATIENCGNSGKVTGSGTDGGIVGFLDKGKSFIIQCKNSGTVEGSSAGGIAGNNRGTISFSYNSGTVMADVDGGGIAAYQTDGEGGIEKCYNEGSVIANSYSGGIIGENESTVSYCYNSGKVRGPGNSGGIAGKNEGTVKYVYGSGVVTGEANSGSLIGRNTGSLITGFWLNTTSALAVGLADNTSNQTTVMRVTHEELSGQQKVKMTEGYEMLINLLNEKNQNWKYLYKITVPAPGSTTVLSDGGSIVNPLTAPSMDSTGNTVDSSDLNSKYLYPVLINE